jgi:hypothetical protein
MRYLVKQLKGTKPVAQMLRVSRHTVERSMKDQINKPRPDLAARPEAEVKKRWQPQTRAKARQKAATTGGIVIGTRARIGRTPPIGSTDEDDQPAHTQPGGRHPVRRARRPLRGHRPRRRDQ